MQFDLSQIIAHTTAVGNVPQASSMHASVCRARVMGDTQTLDILASSSSAM